MTIQVDIPENYLLIIAAHGNMGSGELPDFMKMWAQKICRENGLDSKLRELQIANAKELRSRISNTLGADAMERIDASISEAIQNFND
jgi:uncharacterized protein (DUF3820 family)